MRFKSSSLGLRAPLLIDFGITYQEGVSTGVTRAATGGYAPPEQQAGKPIDESADLFALGMTLAECLGREAQEKQEWES